MIFVYLRKHISMNPTNYFSLKYWILKTYDKVYIFLILSLLLPGTVLLQNFCLNQTNILSQLKKNCLIYRSELFFSQCTSTICNRLLQSVNL